MNRIEEVHGIYPGLEVFDETALRAALDPRVGLMDLPAATPTTPAKTTCSAAPEQPMPEPAAKPPHTDPHLAADDLRPLRPTTSEVWRHRFVRHPILWIFILGIFAVAIGAFAAWLPRLTRTTDPVVDTKSHTTTTAIPTSTILTSDDEVPIPALVAPRRTQDPETQ